MKKISGSLKDQILFLRKKLYLPFFFLSVLFVKLPPFYFLPFLKSQFLTTHSLAVYLVGIGFIFFVLNQLLSGDKGFEERNKVLLAIFLIFLIFQSLSIIPAANTTSFLGDYRNFVFSGFFLFLALDLKKEKGKLITIFIIAAIFNIFYQLFLFFYPELFKSIANIFIYGSHLELVNINLERGRVFIETYDEIVIPFLILLITQKRFRRLSIILLSLIAFTSFASNFRTRILMLFFSFFASVVFVWKGKRKLKIGIISLFVLLGVFAEVVVTSLLGFSFLDRFTFQDKTQDIVSVESRYQSISTAADMGVSHPFFGVGLGNYYDYLPNSKKFLFSFYNWKNKEFSLASQDPHDIFAKILSETGIFSLVFFIGISGFFLKSDIERALYKPFDGVTNAYIVSFWTLFIYSVFNPTTTVSYNSLFWLLRAFI